jgi:hypothetical protein
MPNILTPLKKLLPFRRPRVLPRSRQTYIDRQGWRLTTAGGQPQLEGWYRSRYGSYFGFIQNLDSTRPSFFIKDPPPEVTHHRLHADCFTAKPEMGSNIYSIHFQIPPGDISSGVIEIEGTINEGFLLARRPA